MTTVVMSVARDPFPRLETILNRFQFSRGQARFSSQIGESNRGGSEVLSAANAIAESKTAKTINAFGRVNWIAARALAPSDRRPQREFPWTLARRSEGVLRGAFLHQPMRDETTVDGRGGTSKSPPDMDTRDRRLSAVLWRDSRRPALEADLCDDVRVFLLPSWTIDALASPPNAACTLHRQLRFGLLFLEQYRVRAISESPDREATKLAARSFGVAAAF